MITRICPEGTLLLASMSVRTLVATQLSLLRDRRLVLPATSNSLCMRLIFVLESLVIAVARAFAAATDPSLRQQLEKLVSEARAHGQFVRWAAEARRLLKVH